MTTGEVRRPGRPSTTAAYAPLVRRWLTEAPEITGADVLTRLRRAGYRAGKSAAYVLIARLRAERAETVQAL